jgi:hypothetical protein
MAEPSKAAAYAQWLSGAALLTAEDIVRPRELLLKLRDASSPRIVTAVAKQFRPDTHVALQQYDGAGAPHAALVTAVVDELNRLIESDGDLTKIFRRVAARRDLEKRLSRRPKPEDRRWINRFRLEIVFPEDLARVPINRLEHAGLQLFNGRYRRMYEASIARSLTRLEDAQAVPQDVKERIWATMTESAMESALLEVKQKAARWRILLAMGIAMALILIVAPPITWRLVGADTALSRSNAGQLLAYVAFVLIDLFAMALAIGAGGYLTTRLMIRLDSKTFYVIVFVIWPAVAVVLVANRFSPVLKPPLYAEAAAPLAAAGIWIVGLSALGVIALVHWQLERSLCRDSPGLVLADGLLECLALLGSQDAFDSLDRRARSAAVIDRVALCVERDWPRKFQIFGPADPWISQTAVQLAFGLRELKQWLATPRSDTYEHLVRRLANDLVNAATGSWDRLKRVTPEVPARARRVVWTRRLLVLGRTLLVALLPLAAVLASSRFGFAGDLRNQLAVIAAIWGVLTVVLSLDPDAAKRLPDVNDILKKATGQSRSS